MNLIAIAMFYLYIVLSHISPPHECCKKPWFIGFVTAMGLISLLLILDIPLPSPIPLLQHFLLSLGLSAGGAL